MSILRLILFIPLQLLFLPLAVFGILLVAYKQLVVSSRMGISQTAVEVLNGRWTMHVFNMRSDPATAKLAAALPNDSPLGLWLTLLPLWLVSKLTGKWFLYPRVPAAGEENVADLVIARTLYFDRIIDRVAAEVEQFVLLGAGYDTRAYGQMRHGHITCFELDQHSVQQHKRDSLQAAGIPHDHVRFVSVDFSKDAIFERLMGSGYDPAKKTLFLWEGVTLYLAEADVRRTMRDVRENSAPGSVLLVDLYANRFMDTFKGDKGKKAMEYTDEGFDFGLDFSADYTAALAQFVQSETLAVGETFFMGWKNPKGPFMVVVEMRTP